MTTASSEFSSCSNSICRSSDCNFSANAFVSRRQLVSFNLLNQYLIKACYTNKMAAWSPSSLLLLFLFPTTSFLSIVSFYFFRWLCFSDQIEHKIASYYFCLVWHNHFKELADDSLLLLTTFTQLTGLINYK